MNDALMNHVLRVAYQMHANKWNYSTQVWSDELGQPWGLACYMAYDDVFIAAGLKFWELNALGLKTQTLAFGVGDDGPWLGCDALANLLGLNWNETKFIFGTMQEINRVEPRTITVDGANDIEQLIVRIHRVIAGDFREGV